MHRARPLLYDKKIILFGMIPEKIREELTIIDNTGYDDGIFIKSDYVEIKYFTTKNSKNEGIRIQSNNVNISNNIITNHNFWGITIVMGNQILFIIT